MKERLITLACAVGALALFWAFFIPKPGPQEQAPSRPTTIEHRDNGYLGVVTWLEKAGVRVVKLRRRFDELDDYDSQIARTGNLLVTTMPYRFGVREKELAPLLEWIADGNTLLVMAALGDTPEWAISDGSDLVGDVEQITNIHFASVTDRDADEETAEPAPDQPVANYYKLLEKPERMRMVPNRAHRLFDGVKEVVAESEYPADDWRAILPQDGFVLTLAHEEPSGSAALWVRQYGQGTMIVSTYASLFTNQIIGEGDNARLLSNLVRDSLGEGGAVIFDDTHQGLTALYDPQAFFSDERLHATLWMLFGLWLVWVLGATRLRPAAAAQPAPRESTLTAAVGGYLSRVLRPAQAGVRICEHFFNDVHRRLGQPEDATAVWDWLERQPRVMARDVARLREYHAQLVSGRRVDLRKVHDLTVQIQEQLQ